jgi:glycosyltransferase involved in cell wall biosynthesis
VDRLRRFTENVVVLSRYVPDPDWFGPSASTPEEGMLLYAGKLNYYWRLKTLDSLLAALRIQHTWRLLAVVGGTGREAFAAAVRESGLEGRVRFMDFVSPDQMPDLIAKATAVWAVEREGDVSDFSNIVWEAIACSRPCAVSSGTAGHADSAMFRDSLLLTRVDPEEPLSTVSWLGRLQSVQGATSVDLREAHRTYVDRNAHIYETVCRGVGVGGSRERRDDQNCGEA